MILGFCLLSKAAYQQYRGVTTESAILVKERLAGIVKSGEIVRKKAPEEFRVAMAFHWFLGMTSAFAGVGLYLYIRRQDQLDPFSPDFEIKDEG
jgi:hypothetical protein